jgi:hypothetical protein
MRNSLPIRDRALALIVATALGLLLCVMLLTAASARAGESVRTNSAIVSQFTVPGNRARGLTWDGAYLWLVDASKNVYKLDTTGGVKSTFPITFTPSGMAWDGAGLWIGQDGIRQYKVNTSGTIVGALNVAYWPNSGIAWDGANFWIGDYNFSVIHKHNPSGAELLSWDVPDLFGHPTGLAYDGSALWIGGSGEGFQNDVVKASTTGQLLAKIDTLALGISRNPGEFESVAWDGQYLWYTSDSLFTVYQIDVNVLLSTPTPTSGAPPANRVALPLVLRNHVAYFEGPFEVEDNDAYLQANGPLRSGRDYSGYPDDSRDYFSIFTLDSGLITIALSNHVGSGVQLQLFYQTTDNRLAYDLDPPYQITYNGPPGTYYIYIFTESGFNGVTPYTLRVTYP